MSLHATNIYYFEVKSGLPYYKTSAINHSPRFIFLSYIAFFTVKTIEYLVICAHSTMTLSRPYTLLEHRDRNGKAK